MNLIQSQDVLTHVRNVSFLNLLEESFHQEFLSKVEQISLVKDAYLFHQGDAGDDGMYVVIKGQLTVFVIRPDSSHLVVDEHGPGAVVGEIGMITGSTRTATIQATTDTELIRVSKATFDYLQEKNPEIVSQALDLVMRRLRRPQLLAVLPNLFGPLDLATFEEVEAEFTWLHLARGEQLIQQGDTDENLYILISGRLQAVATDYTGHEQVIGEIAPGESVGEMQLLTGGARSASVYSIRDSALVQLSQDGFDRLVAKYPQIMKHIAQQVIKRLQQTIQRSSNTSKLAKDIVIIPLDQSVPLTEFSEILGNVLGEAGPMMVLDEKRFDAHLGRQGAAQTLVDDPTDTRLVIWLNQQATQYRFRLFQTDFTLTPWTKRCLRQADLILLVGWAQNDPGQSQIEAELDNWDTDWGSVRKHLILLHQEGTKHPQGTERWLSHRQLHHHHHIRWPRVADFERLARFIRGKAIGLVLGGGGVRGLAQLGVIKAIEELGIKIDLVGGSSFGSIIGGYYAMELDYDTIYESVRERSARKALIDYTLPFIALSQGKKVQKVFRQVYGDLNIEDTWRPYFCTSSNLSKAKEVIHRHGPLWKYIRASSALPPLFPPIIEDGMVLMDGGIFNNVPLDIMHQLNDSGPVIGVDVSVDEELIDDYDFDTTVSGWQILWSYLNPFRAAMKIPALHFIVVRMATLTSIQRRMRQENLADLLIYPPVSRFGQLEAEAIDEIIEVGYQTGRPELEAWLAKKA